MTSSYRAFQLHYDAGALQLTSASLPLPSPGPGEVLLKIAAVSLNYRDLLVKADATSANGLIPASDAAGTVAAVGAGVDRWQVGDKVSPGFFAGWQSGPYRREHLTQALGGGRCDGVLREYMLVRAEQLVAVPGHLTLEQAACLPCAAVTAWHALFERGQLTSGQTVVVQGTGGVALFALQLAHAQGAKVIVLSSSDDKLTQATTLGAWRTINYRKQPDWQQQVMQLTEGQGADHILELGGPDTFDKSISCIAPGGNIAQIGVLTGFVTQPNLLPLLFINASINGICVGSLAHQSALNAFLLQHKILPVIDRVFEFTDTAAAYQYLASAQHIGKVVIRLT